MTLGSDLGFWLGKTPDCDTTCKANIAAGVAKGNLIVAMGEVTIVAATAEVAILARTALVGCKSAPVVCLNEAGIATAEALVPGGVGAGGAIGIGKTAAEASAAKAEAVRRRITHHGKQVLILMTLNLLLHLWNWSRSRPAKVRKLHISRWIISITGKSKLLKMGQ